MRATGVTVSALAVVGCLLVLPGMPVRGSEVPGPELREAPEADADAVLRRAVQSMYTEVLVADLVIVGLSDTGPHVTEIALRRGEDGRQQVGQAESWLIDRHVGGAVFEDEAGRLLHLDRVSAVPFQLEDAERAYAVGVAGRADLDTGSAVAVTFTRGGVLRERLFVDDASGIVVRRETYDTTGQPARVVAMTSLDTDSVVMEPAPEAKESSQWPRRRPVELDSLDHETWHLPTSLPQGFDLRASYEVADGGDGIQLVYGDGLYTLSLYEQRGRVDHTSLAGSVRSDVAGWPAYRWPGAEPERIVWTGGGCTFTAVTDAPLDVLVAAVADLPHEPSASLPERFRRGAARLGRLLWPFA